MADQRSFAMKTERPFARGGRKEGRGSNVVEKMERVPARRRGREGGRKRGSRERGRGEVRTSQIARKDACLSASARSRTAFLALVLALRLLPSSGPHFANERPTDRPTATALGIRQRSTRGRGREEGRKEGRRTRGSSLNQHAEFLQGIPAPPPPSFARARSCL